MTAFGELVLLSTGFSEADFCLFTAIRQKKDTTYRTISFLGTNRVVGVFLNPGLTDRSKESTMGAGCRITICSCMLSSVLVYLIEMECNSGF